MSVDDALERAGRDMRSAASVLRDVRADACRVARLAYAQGWSEYAIVKKMGVSRLTVRRWLGKE